VVLEREIITADGASPQRALLFLHGILGHGNNWRGIARRLVEERPSWAAVLVDLRAHGGSGGGEPPHSLAAVARDLDSLESIPTPEAVLGHSYGGKVALAWGRSRALEHAFVIDAMPGARPARRGSEVIAEVLAALRSLPRRFERRVEFVEALTEKGIAEPLARWLATSLERVDDGLRLVIDLDVVDAMLEHYFAADLWDAVPDAAAHVHLVIGTRSVVYDEGDRRRARGIAGMQPHVEICEIDAGHWVHVEAPDALLGYLVESLPPE